MKIIFMYLDFAILSLAENTYQEMKLQFYLIKFMLQKGCTMCQVQPDTVSGSLCQTLSRLSPFLHSPSSCNEYRIMGLVSCEQKWHVPKKPKRGISVLPRKTIMKAVH